MNEQEHNRKFVGNEEGDALPPIYKGRKVKIYPGFLAKHTGVGRSRKSKKRYGLRRYVFSYEGNKFVYLATRKGQRNGGNTASPNQTLVTFKLTAPTGVSETRNFKFTGKNVSGEDIYTEDANSRIRYDSALNRWDWETRPATVPPALPSGPFYTNAYSESTSNALKESGTISQIRWTYVSDPYDTGQPELPATVKFDVKQWYNNNSIDNLNKWPIANTDMNYGKYPNQLYKWQTTTQDTNSVIVPENRPECITDDLLFQCFEGIPLKHYDIVFVEVMWTWFENRKIVDPNNKASFNFGYNSIEDFEWWSPKPFYQKRQKGRIYRIGILDKDNGVGKTDKVIFAQRTRVITTKYFKGGNTALE